MSASTTAVTVMGWRRLQSRAAAASPEQDEGPGGPIADGGEVEGVTLVDGAEGHGPERQGEHGQGEDGVGGPGPAAERAPVGVGLPGLEPGNQGAEPTDHRGDGPGLVFDDSHSLADTVNRGCSCSHSDHVAMPDRPQGGQGRNRGPQADGDDGGCRPGVGGRSRRRCWPGCSAPTRAAPLASCTTSGGVMTRTRTAPVTAPPVLRTTVPIPAPSTAPAAPAQPAAARTWARPPAETMKSKSVSGREAATAVVVSAAPSSPSTPPAAAMAASCAPRARPLLGVLR